MKSKLLSVLTKEPMWALLSGITCGPSLDVQSVQWLELTAY